MKTLYLDCFSGISGDMMLGALLDIGIDNDLFIRELSKVNICGYDVAINKVNKNSITGTDINIIVGGGDSDSYVHGHGPEQKHGHTHEHEHSHENGHTHEHEHSHDENEHAHEHEHSHYENGHTHERDRSLKDILLLIDESELNDEVKIMSKRVFNEIGAAEAKVHNVPVADVHFHEIGAVDSIIDIIGVCICVHLLEIKAIYSSELHEGKGFIDTRHGRLPVPAPAVLAMLEGSGIPIITEDIYSELITPTGIGLAKTLACSFGKMPGMLVEHVGYGFGKRETGRLNALRAVLGELAGDARGPGATITHGGAAFPYNDGKTDTDHIVALEANIDDMTAEAMGYAMERLLAAGALEVFFTPIHMKKNRPATMLTVLARPKDTIILTDIIFKETSTLGIRESHHIRTLMSRRTELVDLEPFGSIRCKIAERKGVRRISPEYEDCRAYAARTGLSLMEVYELARNEYSRLSNFKENKDNHEKHEQ